MNQSWYKNPLLGRLAGCIAGGLVLALMVGSQEGVQEDYGLATRESWAFPRILVFIAIGVLVFLAITYWPAVKQYLSRPGIRPLIAGVATVIAAQALLKWYDPTGNGKFSTISDKFGSDSGLSPLAVAFFSWLGWLQLIVITALLFVAAARRLPILAWIGSGLSVAALVIVYLSHKAVADLDGNIDHSLGSSVAILGYLVMAVSGAAIAFAQSDTAHPRETFDKVVGWRPGLPLVILGAVAGIMALTSATWFAPNSADATLTDTKTMFEGTGLASIAWQYLTWLGWTLVLATVVLGAAGTYLRNRALSWAAFAVGIAGVVLTLVTLYDISNYGNPDTSAGDVVGNWQNLGAGGWLACIALTLMAGGGLVVATTSRTNEGRTAVSSDGVGLRGSSTARSLLFAGVAFAVFYPPTMTEFWQKVLVSEIGIYVLLAVGLNVVVGWAGLLDLGFIAFYAIGSYVTAYLVGSLPHKPPDWLHMSPFWAIPFAIVACLIAGTLLGAPTLRLRGDYLAIVTLGFGEIIRIAAINNPGNITNSTRGPSPAVPHPVLHLGPVHITWGQNNLQYWYLLLVLLVVVVLLFYRLEGSRLGRAWAAIREDEVAAQATGINTVRVKLLAFAIGASTSGLAGWFFATQIGYFNPDNFVLNNSILVVAYVVFGGMGSLPGAMAGAAVLTWLPEFLKDQVPGADRQMWIGAVVLLMMIFRPEGLIPAKRRKAELHGLDDAPLEEAPAVPENEGLGAVPK